MSEPPLSVRSIDSFHVGGRAVVLRGLAPREFRVAVGSPTTTLDQNGEIEAFHLYAQAVRLAAPKRSFPLMLWHGGGLSGVCWETTPDGRPGWQTLFLRAGWDVVVSDAVERGRAGFAPHPQVYADAPLFRTKQHAWDIFRFGPPGGFEARAFHPDTRFPRAGVDALAAQAVGRWMGNEEATIDAYVALLEKLGPSVVVGHSQSGHFAHQVALRRPDLLKALVLLEPTAAPDPATVVSPTLARIPHLYVWGDYIRGYPYWERYMALIERWRDALRAAGARVDWWDLPLEGVRGNSHMLMMDDNNAALAARVQAWLDKVLRP